MRQWFGFIPRGKPRREVIAPQFHAISGNISWAPQLHRQEIGVRDRGKDGRHSIDLT